MSLDATRWAWQQAIKPTRKLVLLSIADRADEVHRCYPSIARLVQDTGLDRETIMEAIQDMESAGLMVVTRRGGSSSIYQLVGVPDRNGDDKTGRLKSTNQSVKPDRLEAPDQSGKSDRSENPDQSGKPDNTSRKNPTPTSRKNPTHNLPTESTKNLEPPLPPLKPKFDPLLVLLPDCLLPDQWRRWVEYRRSIKKPLSLPTTEAQLRQLVEWHQAGHDPNEILAASVRNSWQGIFKPKSGDTHGTHPRQDNSAVARVERAIRDQEERELRERDGSFVGGHIIDVGREDYQHLAYSQAVEADD